MLFSEPKILNGAALEDQSDFCEEFQCSSASRKFSIHQILSEQQYRIDVSVLFSEPKILNRLEIEQIAANDAMFQCSSASRKFSIADAGCAVTASRVVSVLFSEPKILNDNRAVGVQHQPAFQCSSASRKFSIRPSHLRPSIFPTAMITLRHS